MLECNGPIKLSVDNCFADMKIEAPYAFKAKLSQQLQFLVWFFVQAVVDGEGLICTSRNRHLFVVPGQSKPIPENWVPLCEFLLRLGEPWEPYLWDLRYDTQNLNKDLLTASQQFEAVLQDSVDIESIDDLLLATSHHFQRSVAVFSHWTPPTDSSEVSVLQNSKGTILQTTQNQNKLGTSKCGEIGPITNKKNLVEEDIPPTSRQFC